MRNPEFVFETLPRTIVRCRNISSCKKVNDFHNIEIQRFL